MIEKKLAIAVARVIRILGWSKPEMAKLVDEMLVDQMKKIRDEDVIDKEDRR